MRVIKVFNHLFLFLLLIGIHGTVAAECLPYSNDPRFSQLAADPAHAGRVSIATAREAAVGIEAEFQHKLLGPIDRGPAEIEFYDAKGYPWDVKAPISPGLNEHWKFDADQVVQSVTKKMRRGFPHEKTDSLVPVGILLDTSQLTEEDHETLMEAIARELSPKEALLLIEIPILQAKICEP